MQLFYFYYMGYKDKKNAIKLAIRGGIPEKNTRKEKSGLIFRHKNYTFEPSKTNLSTCQRELKNPYLQP